MNIIFWNDELMGNNIDGNIEMFIAWHMWLGSSEHLFEKGPTFARFPSCAVSCRVHA